MVITIERIRLLLAHCLTPRHVRVMRNAESTDLSIRLLGLRTSLEVAEWRYRTTLATLEKDLTDEREARSRAEERTGLFEQKYALLQKWLMNASFWLREDKRFSSAVLLNLAVSPEMPYQLSGAELILAERLRQMDVEGWSADHDDIHEFGELRSAARCYLALAERNAWGRHPVPSDWPWESKWWKPGTLTRNLVKSGALIAAEIDRLTRLEGRGE